MRVLKTTIFPYCIFEGAWWGYTTMNLYNIYSGAQAVCKIYSEPLGSYSEPLNFVPNPAIFSQKFYVFCLFNQFSHSLNNFTKFISTGNVIKLFHKAFNNLRSLNLCVCCLENLNSLFLEYIFVNIK